MNHPLAGTAVNSNDDFPDLISNYSDDDLPDLIPPPMGDSPDIITYYLAKCAA